MAEKFGELLRAVREKAGKSMGDLARALGVSVPYVSDVELSRRPPLTNERITAAAEFLGIDDPSPLLAAAAESRGSFELEAQDVGPKAREVGVALMRAWSELTDTQLTEIQKIVERRGKKVA